jgi:hypothetical protein
MKATLRTQTQVQTPTQSQQNKTNQIIDRAHHHHELSTLLSPLSAASFQALVYYKRTDSYTWKQRKDNRHSRHRKIVSTTLDINTNMQESIILISNPKHQQMQKGISQHDPTQRNVTQRNAKQQTRNIPTKRFAPSQVQRGFNKTDQKKRSTHTQPNSKPK